jgi:hypothetical protein
MAATTGVSKAIMGADPSRGPSSMPSQTPATMAAAPPISTRLLTRDSGSRASTATAGSIA